MAERTFAPWVAPAAAQLRESRAEVVRLARALPPHVWEQPSPNEGWSYKELLAHLAAGDWFFQRAVRSVVHGDEIDLTIPFQFVNDGNARLVAERRDRTVEELIGEAEAVGEETQKLLAQLSSDEQAQMPVARRMNGATVTMEAFVKGFPAHDPMHLAQLRAALETERTT